MPQLGGRPHVADGMRVVFPERARGEAKSEISLGEKLAFIRDVMTGREAETPIRGRNYTQVQRDDYTARGDRLQRCRVE